MNTLWVEIRNNLRKKLKDVIYNVWLDTLYGIIEEDTLFLYAPSSFMAAKIRERLTEDIIAAANEVCGKKMALHIEAGSCSAKSWNSSDREIEVLSAKNSGADLKSLSKHKKNDQAFKFLLQHKKNSPLPLPHKDTYSMGQNEKGSARSDSCAKNTVFSGNRQLGLSFSLPGRKLCFRYSFDNFVIGPFNELAHAAARSMSRDNAPVKTLFLSSAHGLGKTHISHAVGRDLSDKSNKAGLRVEYLTAEEFSSSFVQSLKARDTQNFKSRFRELDLLLFEDVEFLQKKEKMQEELLATVKAIQSRGGRVLFTSHFAPMELDNLDSQLVSRFCSGFLADIGKPDASMRRVIICEKAKALGYDLPNNISEMLASALPGDIRQIESCLSTLILRARVLSCTFSEDLVQDVLSQYAKCEHSCTLDDIIRKVCVVTGIEQTQIKSHSRRQNCVLARNLIFLLARKHTDLSLEEIGNKFGRRHSTVIKGIAAIERELGRETPLGRQAADMLTRLSASH